MFPRMHFFVFYFNCHGFYEESRAFTNSPALQLCGVGDVMIWNEAIMKFQTEYLFNVLCKECSRSQKRVNEIMN